MDEDGNVSETLDPLEWAKNFSMADRRVAFTEISDTSYLSTVFLGLDHGFLFNGPPLIFESMLFGTDEELCQRYSTREDALKGHLKILLREKVPVEKIFSME